MRIAVPSYEVATSEAGFGQRQHARYRVVCHEAGAQWTVHRRWTELRMTVDALKQTHPAAFTSPKMPSFEPHAWWRIGSSALDPAFLKSRAENMQLLLQALVDLLDVSVSKQRGPSALLALLVDCDPGMSVQAPRTPAEWRRAQLAAPDFESPISTGRACSPESDSGGGGEGGESTELPPWLTEADAFLNKTAGGRFAVGRKLEGAAAAKATPVASPATPAVVLHAPAEPAPAAAPPPEQSTPGTPDTLDADASATDSPFAQLEQMATAPPSSAPAPPPRGIRPPEPPKAEAAPKPATRAQPPASSPPKAAAKAKAKVEAAAAPPPPAPGPTPGPTPAFGGPAGITPNLMAEARRRAAAMHDKDSYEAFAEQMRSDPRLAGSAAARDKKKAGKKQWPTWAILLVAAVVVLRAGYLLSKLTPSNIRERVEEERRKNDPRRPIQGPRGLMYPVDEPQQPQQPQQGDGMPAAELAHTSTPTPTPALSRSDEAARAARARKAQQEEAAAADSAAPASVRSAARQAATRGIVRSPPPSPSRGASAVPSPSPLTSLTAAGDGRPTDGRLGAASAARQRAEEASRAATAELEREASLLRSAQVTATGELTEVRTQAAQALAAAAAAAAAELRAADDVVASAQAEAEAAARAEEREAGVLEALQRKLDAAKAARRGAQSPDEREAAGAAQTRAEHLVKQAAAQLKAARKQLKATSKQAEQARTARDATARQSSKATAKLTAHSEKLIEKAAQRNRKTLSAHERRLDKARSVAQRAQTAVETAADMLTTAELLAGAIAAK